MSLRPNQIQGAPARLAALKLVDAVLRRGETLEQALPGATSGLLTHSDVGLARALASEVLRWLADLDALIDGAMKKPLPDDAKARSVLRIMLAGWLRLETPPHAVVATGLPLLAGGPRRLAHGVFSTLVKRGATLPGVPTLPEAVRERWGERAAAIAAGLGEPPPLDTTWKVPIVEPLGPNEGLGAFSLMPGHVRFPRGVAVEAIAGFAEGGFWVQDLAASLPARLLGHPVPSAVDDPVEDELLGLSKRRKHVLDLCAAPGGKTLQLVHMGWRVTSVDKSDRRLDRLRENLARMHCWANVVVADALEWEPDEPFDAVLLDAPCTATGTARRHPDVLHRIGPRQIAEMAELQAALLDRAVRWLKPGGRLVYAVCSLEREEGEEQAARVALPRLPVMPSEVPHMSPTPEGWLRTDPGMMLNEGGLDGFFIARFRANG